MAKRQDGDAEQENPHRPQTGKHRNPSRIPDFAYCTEIVKGLCSPRAFVTDLKQADLLELEFEQVPVERLEQEFRGAFDNSTADLVGIGILGIDEDDRLAAI